MPVGGVKYFLCVLGMVMVFEGIPYFCFPEKMKAFFKKIPELPDLTLRVLGLILLIVGLFIVYLGRS
ncbi:MAG: DUF2065 domain-containing protein [bacterium]